MNARGRSTIVLSAVLAGAWIVAPASRAQETRVPDDAAIREILEQRIDTDRRGVGIVVGVLEPSGQRIVSHGTFAVGDSRPVDADTERTQLCRASSSTLFGVPWALR